MPNFLKKLLCCECKRDPEEKKDNATENKSSKAQKAKSGWEHDALYNNVLAQDIIKHAAIVSFPNGVVKASNFESSQEGIAAVIKAFEGDPSSILEGIKLSENLPLYSPGKMEENKAIYGTAIAESEDQPSTGGCAIVKTKTSMIVCAFDKDLEGATNFAMKIADGLIEKGY